MDATDHNIYREMLSVALEQLHEVEREPYLILCLLRRCNQLEAELGRYVRSQVSDASTSRLPDRAT